MSVNASETYRSYIIKQFSDGDIEICDDSAELVDAGFKNFDEAREYIDALEEV